MYLYRHEISKMCHSCVATTQNRECTLNDAKAIPLSCKQPFTLLSPVTFALFNLKIPQIYSLAFKPALSRRFLCVLIKNAQIFHKVPFL